jgi:hypothetical protein
MTAKVAPIRDRSLMSPHSAHATPKTPKTPAPPRNNPIHVFPASTSAAKTESPRETQLAGAGVGALVYGIPYAVLETEFRVSAR